MSYPNIMFLIQGWFLIIVINSLDTDQALRNVPLDLDLNWLKLDSKWQDFVIFFIKPDNFVDCSTEYIQKELINIKKNFLD